MYNPEYHRQWYLKNRERLLDVRRAYNKEYSKRPEVIEKAKQKNATVHSQSVRKVYKQTAAAKSANLKYRTKPEVVERVRRRRLELRYGITHEEYEMLLQKQHGLCAICKVPTIKFHIDHDHKTNKVRGLLCGPCNMGLGLFKDNKVLLALAITYLG